MSLTYRPINKIEPHCRSQYDDGGWDVNSAGSEILGGLHEQLKLVMCNEGKTSKGRPPRVPYSMDEATALATAKRLSDISDEAVKATFEKYKFCWEDKPDAVEDYLTWVRDWQKFLLVCGGYIAD